MSVLAKKEVQHGVSLPHQCSMVRQPGEMAQLHELGHVGVTLLQPAQGLVRRDQVLRAGPRAAQVRRGNDATVGSL